MYSTYRYRYGRFSVQGFNENDEVVRYQMGNYMRSNEAVWRILLFSIHEREPSVTHLAIHLKNGQRVYFTKENTAQRAASPPKTTLTELFQLCQQNVYGRFAKLYYILRFLNISHGINKIKNGYHAKEVYIPVKEIFSTNVLDRFYTVHPRQRDCFYLRLLLINDHGPTSFEWYLRTVSGQLHTSYHDACQALQLLEENIHWNKTLADAVLTLDHLIEYEIYLLTTCSQSIKSKPIVGKTYSTIRTRFK